MNLITELKVWMEEMRPIWRTRGADVIEREGMTIFKRVSEKSEVDCNPDSAAYVIVGPVEFCKSAADPSVGFNIFEPLLGLVPLVVLGDISVEHSKILIENAVEQVAGRIPASRESYSDNHEG